MKRHRAEREGIISSLPARILHHILSFLYDDKEAARTCLLSKSWRHLWSTRPNFSLYDFNFRKNKKFIDVLERSLQVYYDRKPCIEKLDISVFKVKPELVLLLEKWIPIVLVKKFHLYTSCRGKPGLPSAVFESESLQEIHLEHCNLRKINSIGNNNHLKTLILRDVCIEEETNFAKFLSIEHLSLHYCEGLGTINMPNHHNLKKFEIESVYDSSIEIYLPRTIGYIYIHRCPNWYHHGNYFPGLTCLKLSHVPLSHEWFNSFSRNFPCLEELKLSECNGFDELKLSSRSIKKLHIWMDGSTKKATINTPNIIYFHYGADISQSISFFSATSSEWNAQIDLTLCLGASQWFLKLIELVSVFRESQINSLVLKHYSDIENPDIEHLSDIPIFCGSYKLPVAMKSLCLVFSGHYYDFFLSDLVIGLFRFVRPTEIRKFRKGEFLCRTLQMGRWEDEGMRSFWQQDLEEVSLEVDHGGGPTDWHPVEGTINWSEYVAVLHSDYELRFQLKWRE